MLLADLSLSSCRLWSRRHDFLLCQRERVEDGAMEALANAIGLRALGLGAGMVDVLNGEIELVFVALRAAKLGAAIGQHARQADAVLVIKRHHPIIEDF